MLGIYDGPSGGAALLHEGRLLAIAEEDRLVRHHRVSGIPRASVQTVLRGTVSRRRRSTRSWSPR